MIRISGAGTESLLRKFFIPQNESKAFEHRRMTYARLEGRDGGLIDECSAVFYRAPNSYTGEDMAEVFLHGSPAAVNALFRLLEGETGVRPAEPGEFTKRAFLNGKTDLSGAEAVMDMISASTELARKAAAFQLEGGLKARIDELYDGLCETAAYAAAVTDYPEEMEDEAIEGGELAERILKTETAVDALIENGLASRLLREGARVAIMGVPNSGKSSLLNALLKRERAIVTPFAGTTRDTIEERADVNGVPVTFIDTAGIRSACDIAERMGVERALREGRGAHAALWLHECGTPVTSEEAEAFRSLNNSNVILLLTKADLCCEPSRDEEACFAGVKRLLVSSRTGEGIFELKDAVAKLLHPTDEQAIVTNTRHIDALKKAKTALTSARNAVETGLGLDCCATDLAEALELLGSITGRTASEDVIDMIFSRFCVGK